MVCLCYFLFVKHLLKIVYHAFSLNFVQMILFRILVYLNCILRRIDIILTFVNTLMRYQCLAFLSCVHVYVWAYVKNILYTDVQCQHTIKTNCFLSHIVCDWIIELEYFEFTAKYFYGQDSTVNHCLRKFYKKFLIQFDLNFMNSNRNVSSQLVRRKYLVFALKHFKHWMMTKIVLAFALNNHLLAVKISQFSYRDLVAPFLILFWELSVVLTPQLLGMYTNLTKHFFFLI